MTLGGGYWDDKTAKSLNLFQSRPEVTLGGCETHKSTNKQIPSEASEEPSDTVIHFYFGYFFIHRRALLSANQKHAMIGECSQNKLSEAFWTPNVSSTHTSN